MDDWIDQHIRLVRLIPWCIGSVGVYLVFKHTYMFTRFRNVASIPNNLISSNHILSGRVITCSHGLRVWHVPLGYRLLRWNTRPPKESNINDSLLYVKFAGIYLQSETTQRWLETNLNNQMIRFVLLKRSQEEESVECIVYKPFKYSFNAMSINELLLKEGMAIIKDNDHTSFTTKFADKEALAKRRGRGLWEGSEFESWPWWVWRKLKQLFIRNRP